MIELLLILLVVIVGGYFLYAIALAVGISLGVIIGILRGIFDIASDEKAKKEKGVKTPVMQQGWPYLLLILFFVGLAWLGPRLGLSSQEETMYDTARSGVLNNLKELSVREENRCSPYDGALYPYRRDVLRRALKQVRWSDRPFWVYIKGDEYVLSLYTLDAFVYFDVDVDHIVALSEAHDSGACSWDSDKRVRFANDLNNLEFASRFINREFKRGKDWNEWQPTYNDCFFANKIIAIKKEYNLSVDKAEFDALASTLITCAGHPDAPNSWD